MGPEVAYSMLPGLYNPYNLYTFSKSTQRTSRVSQIHPGDIGCIVVPAKDFYRAREALVRTASWFGGGGWRRAWRHGDGSGKAAWRHDDRQHPGDGGGIGVTFNMDWKLSSGKG